MAASHRKPFTRTCGTILLTFDQIIGPKDSTVPQAGLDTKTRAGPLAQLIVKQITEQNLDPQGQLLFNPIQWRNASNVFFAAGQDWLQPPVELTINGRSDAFSQRYECLILRAV